MHVAYNIVDCIRILKLDGLDEENMPQAQKMCNNRTNLLELALPLSKILCYKQEPID